MKHVIASPTLKWALTADALLAAGVAALHLSAPDALASWLQLPQALIQGTGIFLVAWAVLLFWLARTPRTPRALVMGVIDGNLLWALGAIGLLLAGTLTPSIWGNAYLVLNALNVLAFAALEWHGLRRSQPTAPVRAARA